VNGPIWAIPEVYIPLLFLMLEGHCALRQEEFFGEIYVQICRAGESFSQTLQDSHRKIFTMRSGFW